MSFIKKRNKYLKMVRKNRKHRWKNEVHLYNQQFTDGIQDTILTQNIRLSTNREKTKLNNNICAVGGYSTNMTDAGVVQCFLVPNIKKADSNYVILDPYKHILKNTRDTLEENGYEIQIIDLTRSTHSYHYNPFKYLKTEDDIMCFVNSFVGNYVIVHQEDATSELFVRAISVLSQSIIHYMLQCLPKEEQNFNTFIALLNSVNEDKPFAGKRFPQSIQELKDQNIEHIAVQKYIQFEAIDEQKMFSHNNHFRSVGMRQPNTMLDNSDDVNLEDLDNGKKAVFIITGPLSNIDCDKRHLSCLFIQQAISQLNAKANTECYVHFMLHRVCALGDAFPLLDVLENASSSNTHSIHFTVHNLCTLSEVQNKKADNILSSCDSILYFGSDCIDTMVFLRKIMLSHLQLSFIEQCCDSKEAIIHNPNLGDVDLMRMPPNACLAIVRGIGTFYDEKYGFNSLQIFPFLLCPY